MDDKNRLIVGILILGAIFLVGNQVGLFSTVYIDPGADDTYGNMDCQRQGDEWVCSVTDMLDSEIDDCWFDEGREICSGGPVAATVTTFGHPSEWLGMNDIEFFVKNVYPGADMSTSYATFENNGWRRFDERGSYARGHTLKFKMDLKSSINLNENSSFTEDGVEDNFIMTTGRIRDNIKKSGASSLCTIEDCGWEFEPPLEDIDSDASNPYDDYEMEYSITNIKFHFPLKDTDSDGIFDDKDQCPETGDVGYGLKENGCPKQDKDGDGILDENDECINNYGSTENGCPSIFDKIVSLFTSLQNAFLESLGLW